MKKGIIFLIFVLITTNIYAQYCTICMGRGYLGYRPCAGCGGSGTYQAQVQRLNAWGEGWGEAAKDLFNIRYSIVEGQQAIVNGDYDSALSIFEELSNKGIGEALFYYGIMHELGMGVYVDKDYAYKCYKLGSEKGDSECKAGINRIINDGYFEANEDTRKRFRIILQNYLRIHNLNANYSNTPSYPNTNSGSSKYSCNSCSGTGRCTACNGSGQQHIDLYYTGGEKIANCPVCNGSGKCGVCYGNGAFY